MLLNGRKFWMEYMNMVRLEMFWIFLVANMSDDNPKFSGI